MIGKYVYNISMVKRGTHKSCYVFISYKLTFMNFSGTTFEII